MERCSTTEATPAALEVARTGCMQFSNGVRTVRAPSLQQPEARVRWIDVKVHSG